MRVVFMGTPEFGAASLEKLITEGYNVVGVFTQPDKPKGRGMSISISPVKALALAHDLRVYQPTSMRDGEAYDILSALRPDVIVVVSYGRILPETILDLPPLGCVNVHASLLPKYRGSSPIQSAILSGDPETGVTTMYLAPEMDTGDIIFSEKTEIGEFETSGELFERLMTMGAELLHRTLTAIEQGTAPRIPQDHTKATYTKPLEKKDCPIDWTLTPRQIVKHICALQPWPVATMELAGTTVRVFSAAYTDRQTVKAPGCVVAADKLGIAVACGSGQTLRITELQAPGKKRMFAAAYLAGHPIQTE